MQDLNDKITGNTLTAAEWNELPSEIQNIIEGLGITLSGSDLNQLGKAIAGYVANGTFYTDSGAANAYVFSVIGSKQTPAAYTVGMIVKGVIVNENTGASTINVGGLGVKNIKQKDSVAPIAGVLASGEVAELRYDGTNFIIEQTEERIFTTTIQSRLNGPPIVVDANNVEIGQFVRCWVFLNQTGTQVIRDSFNVLSITDVGVGETTITFIEALDGNNAIFGTAGTGKLFVTSNVVGGNSGKIITYSDTGTLTDASFCQVQFLSQ